MPKVTILLNPAAPDGTNRGVYGVSIINEIPDDLPIEEQKEKADKIFELVNYFADKIVIPASLPTTINVTPKSIVSNGTYKKACNDQSSKPVSKEQLVCLNRGAAFNNITLEEYLLKFGYTSSELNSCNANKIIQQSMEASKRQGR